MKTFITMLCLSATMLFAQTVTIEDNSPFDSPLHFKGYINLDLGKDAACSITGHNKDTRTIVAWSVELQGMEPNGTPYSKPFGHDHFFADDAHISMMSPKPGLDFDSGLRCDGFLHGISPVLVKPSITIKVVFVQFSDGSIWGDPLEAKETAFQRQDAIDYLKSLQSLPDLRAAVAKEPIYAYGSRTDDHVRWMLLITWKYLSEDSTSEAIASDIKRRLAIAETHKAWMDALK